MDQTRSYDGATPQDAWEQFQADSREAAAHGWAPADQSWQEAADGRHRLNVTYRSQGGKATAASLAIDPPQPGKRSRRRWIVAGLGVLLLLAAASAAGGERTESRPSAEIAAASEPPQPVTATPTAKETAAPTRNPPAKPTDPPIPEPTPAPTAPPLPATMSVGVGLNDHATLRQVVARIRTGRLVAWVAQLNEPVGSDALNLVVKDGSGAAVYAVALSFADPDLDSVGSEEDLSDLGAGKYILELQKAGRVIATGNFEYVTPPPTEPPPPPPAPEPDCHPSYTGACLDPGSPDYDCAGGSGNGPDYTGTVRVVGPDEYELDRDGDGYGCE